MLDLLGVKETPANSVGNMRQRRLVGRTGTKADQQQLTESRTQLYQTDEDLE